jgi:dihydrofolate reductase
MPQHLNQADTLLMGRNTYEAYASGWPDRYDPTSDRINTMPNLVVSQRPEQPELHSLSQSPGVLGQRA